MSKNIYNDWIGPYLRQAALNSPDLSSKQIIQQIDRLVARGGKRLRSSLCLIAYEAYGGSSLKNVLPTAAAIELLHTFLLIHDDIIDRDDVRYGGPTISAAYFERLSKNLPVREALHWAQSQALLAGDICHVLATSALLQTDCQPSDMQQLLRYWQHTTMQVLQGELMDMNFSSMPSITSKEVLQMYEQKTASYTFVLPLIAGALLAGAPAIQLALLERAGKLLGIAYQLRDDVQGIFGDPAKTGKSNLSDLREGKRTFMLLETLQHATVKDRTLLLGLLGNPKIDQNGAEKARTIFTKSGSLTSVESVIQRYCDEAKDLLKNTSMNPKGLRAIDNIIKSIVDK